MNEDFINAMVQAIAKAPNAKIARQLEILLARLTGTDGEVRDILLPETITPAS